VSPAIAVHHRVDGPDDAPVLVLSHSLGTRLELFERQAAALSRRFRVVRYDLRGHGRSTVPPGPYEMADLGADLIALLDRIGAGRAHLCGVSLGGMASLWTAAHHPGRVASLVLCCTSAQLGPPSLWRDRAAGARAGGVEAIADAIVARWFTPAYVERHPDRVAAMRAALVATPAAGYSECCGAIERMDLRPELAAVKAPTLAIAAAEDPATPPEHLARIAHGIAGARLVVIDGASHLAIVEKADEITALVAEHLVAPEVEP
jgi:3-oxoadipate enol-lactonase